MTKKSLNLNSLKSMTAYLSELQKLLDQYDEAIERHKMTKTLANRLSHKRSIGKA